MTKTRGPREQPNAADDPLRRLDFSPRLPCEQIGHHRGEVDHDAGPAQWVVRWLCGGCGLKPLQLLCTARLMAYLAAQAVICPGCGHEYTNLVDCASVDLLDVTG